MFFRYGSASNQTSFRSKTPMGSDVIARYAPSVMADEPHESRGDRYQFISTAKALDGLAQNGFLPYEVRQTKTRDVSKREHTKHMLRLRHASSGGANEVPEIILLNSHDGTSSYRLMSGVFRMVCSNGLIAGDLIDDIRIRHSGKIVDDVIEGSFRVLESSTAMVERIDAYKATQLTLERAQKLARDAMALRWEPNKSPVKETELLLPRRHADVGADLWRVFNRIQENIIKGGLSGRTATGGRTQTRAVTSVAETVRLNRQLWDLADACL